MTIESLSDQNIIKVKRYLGYPTLANRKNLYSSVPLTVQTALLLEKHVRSIDGPYALEEINDLISKITCSREKIEEAKCSRLSLTEVAYSVKFYKGEIATLWEEDYKLCEQLADLLFVPIYKHPTGRGYFYDLNGGNGSGNSIGISY